MLGPIGKNQIVIGAAQFEVGQSTTDYSDDGALGVDSYGLNPFVIPGAMYSLAAATAHSTAPVDNIIATCPDFEAANANNRYLVGDGANLYSFNGTTLTKQKTGSATYIEGITDISPHLTDFYLTSTTGISQWNGTSTLNESFYTTNWDGDSPHPLLKYVTSLYVGNGNLLVAIDKSASASVILTLPVNETIVALGVDPLTGLMLISTTNSYDISDHLPPQHLVYLYDGGSNIWTRRIPVDELICSFTNWQGQVICGYGFGIGIWNGLGVTYLRGLFNTTVSNGNLDLPYKHHCAAIGKMFFVIDGAKVLTYGPVKAGQMGFFYTAYEQTNTPPSDHLTALFNVGAVVGNRLGYTYYDATTTDYYFYTVDFGSTAAGTGILTTNNIYFPRPVNIREIVVITTPQTTGTTGTCTFYDQDGNAPSVQSFVTASAESPKSTFNFNFSGYQCYMVRPQIDFAAQGFGIIKMMIYYDVAI